MDDDNTEKERPRLIQPIQTPKDKEPPPFMDEDLAKAAATDLVGITYKEARDFLYARLNDSIKAGHLPLDGALDIFQTYRRHCETILAVVHRYPIPQSERSNIAHSLLTLTIGLYAAGARDKKLISRMRADSTANARASRNLLDKTEVDRIILAIMDDPKIKAPSDAKRAELTLTAVNDALMKEGANQGKKAPQYKSADVLRAVYQRAKKSRKQSND